MAFRTKLDYSNNRQIKQFEKTQTILSGGTSFGLPFNQLTSGPNLLDVVETNSFFTVGSTFSGNNTTTLYSWYDPAMILGEPFFSAITPTNSGETQSVELVFAPETSTVIDGNTVNLTYTGVSFDITPIAMFDLGGGDYSGTVETTELVFYSASSLDYTGRTIWVDVSGITRTNDLIISNDPVIGNVFTCIDSEGRGAWLPSSGSTSGTSINWYKENATPPIKTPVSSGDSSIAVGDGAEALEDYMYVLGDGAGSGATKTQHAYFLGYEAGYGVDTGDSSILIGFQSGKFGDSINNVVFIGANSGTDGVTGSNSVLIGAEAGNKASSFTNAIMIGYEAGKDTVRSDNSIFIGYRTGIKYNTDDLDENNIIIGTNISLPDGRRDSLNIGGVLFGSGLYSTTTGDPSVSANTNGRIGIGVVLPQESLDVIGNGRFRTIGSGASAGALHYTADGVLTTNTSDVRLKTDINTIENSLELIHNLRGVYYKWKEGGGNRIGFIAQEVSDAVPELAFVNNNTEEKYMGVHYDNVTALLVEGVKELTKNKIKKHTPENSEDKFGEENQMVYDENYVYVKTSNGWKRSKLESF
jgi:hypothetical protein